MKCLVEDHLSDQDLSLVCAVIDQVIWKVCLVLVSKGNLKTAIQEYKSRTTSNALRSVGSQIGRNIKSLVC